MPTFEVIYNVRRVRIVREVESCVVRETITAASFLEAATLADEMSDSVEFNEYCITDEEPESQVIEQEATIECIDLVEDEDEDECDSQCADDCQDNPGYDFERAVYSFISDEDLSGTVVHTVPEDHEGLPIAWYGPEPTLSGERTYNFIQVEPTPVV